MEQFALGDVRRVEFYKRDELTTDLMCCEVTVGDVCHFSHEEESGWDGLIRKLAALPGFDAEWFAHVSQLPFAESRYVAFNGAD